MRSIFLALIFLLTASFADAQSTTVSGTITDSGGQAWFAGTIQFRFRPADSNPTAQYFWNGVPFDKNTTIPANPLTLDGSGSFSGVSIPSNTAIAPANSKWTTTVCPAATIPTCYTVNLTITGATQNITSLVIPPPVVVNMTVPLLGAKAYTDAEIQGASPGAMYLNVTDNKNHLCIQTGFPPCTWSVQGNGTVTSFSAGNLSPLFTTTVANPTTTPALSFTLSNAAAGTVYGNPSGSPAPPSFNPLSSFGGVVSSVTGTANEITASPTTGAVVLSFPTAVIMPGSLEVVNGITSDSGDISAGNHLFAVNNIQSTSGGVIINSGSNFTFNGGNRIAYDSGTQSTHFRVNGGADSAIIALGLTLSGIGANNCLQTGVGGAVAGTGSPCPAGSGFTQISLASKAPGCTTAGGNSFDNCTDTLTWNNAFADNGYVPICFGQNAAGSGTPGSVVSLSLYSVSLTASQITVVTQTLRSIDGAFGTIYCVGVHP